eukprot:CCRYP_007299-RA/>CCRYP_007299-RA protein AED:0.46 eAED:0.61 QI:0/0/0/1/0/0/3/0/128
MQMVYLSPHLQALRPQQTSYGWTCVHTKQWETLFKRHTTQHTASKNKSLEIVDGEPISTVADLSWVFRCLIATNVPTCTLLLTHSVIKHGLDKLGILQINANQLNHHYSFDNVDIMTQEQFVVCVRSS